MAIHPKVLAALEEIDAAVFGETFGFIENRQKLEEYLARWRRELNDSAIHVDDDGVPL